jgi:diketogulonate reductase-like aldo/keto reductase
MTSTVKQDSQSQALPPQPQQKFSSEEEEKDPTYLVNVDSGDGCTEVQTRVPCLAFGLYKVPNDQEGERIVVDAIHAGYRHFDSASIYGNEPTVGRAFKHCLTHSSSSSSSSSSLQQSAVSVSRSDLFVASKVWNDVQKQGRDAVRQSVLKSLQDLQLEYLDICYVHWPVPNHYIDTYKELQQLLKEQKIRSIGISNFTPSEYENLMADPDVTIQPLIHQFEISPFMYRPSLIEYFQKQQCGGSRILIAASKALNRTVGISDSNDGKGSIVQQIADAHGISTAQIMLRWSYQKGFIVLAKTSNPRRMTENRSILGFDLTEDEMQQLDGLTSPDDIQSRTNLEEERKRG